MTPTAVQARQVATLLLVRSKPLAATVAQAATIPHKLPVAHQLPSVDSSSTHRTAQPQAVVAAMKQRPLPLERDRPLREVSGLQAAAVVHELRPLMV
jgi:hypothetical protein